MAINFSEQLMKSELIDVNKFACDFFPSKAIDNMLAACL
jgi:hypothetical protein